MFDVDPNKMLFSYPQAGKILGVGRHMVAVLVREGQLATVPTGKIPRVTRASLEALLRRLAGPDSSVKPGHRPPPNNRVVAFDEPHRVGSSVPRRRR